MTAGIIARDAIAGQVGPLMQAPKQIRHLSDADFQGLVDECLRWLRRVRMGGRSTPLEGMAILLWYGHEKQQLHLDIEETLSLAFRVAYDPSFVRPEWGIILAGVLMARYTAKLPDDAVDEILRQCRLLLRDLEVNVSVLPSARAAAKALLEASDSGFPSGLDPVVQAALASWPTTDGLSDVPESTLNELIADIETRLPTHMSQREQRLYRLYMERKGAWQLLEKVSVK